MHDPFIELEVVFSNRVGHLGVKLIKPELAIELSQALKDAGFRAGDVVQVNLKQVQREWTDRNNEK